VPVPARCLGIAARDSQLGLVDALRPEEIAIYGGQTMGKKYLINPNAGFGN